MSGWVVAICVCLDQALKAWMIHHPQPRVLIPGVLGLTYTENTGVAFSLLEGSPFLTVGLSIGLLGVLCVYAWKSRTTGWERVCVSLITGGALSNLLDRCLRGYVVDMMEVLFVHFAIWNLADAFVVTGCIVWMGMLLLRKDRTEHGVG